MSPLKHKLEDVRILDPRPRGKAFEGFLGAVFTSEHLRHRLAYRPSGEEIDGAIWWQQRTILLEAKWVQDPLPASSIYAFKGKVDGKFDGTLGVFVSMSGYSKDCVKALSHGKSLNILLFDGDDIEAIADGTRFTGMLEEKLFAAGQTGNVYLPWNELDQTRALIASSKETTAAKMLVVICEGPSDKIILDSLISHVAQKAGKSADPKFLVSYGKHPLMESLVPSLASLLSRGVDESAAIVTVFDADTTDLPRIIEQRQRVLKNLEDIPASWNVHVGIGVPEIEDWIGVSQRLSIPQLRQHLDSLVWDDRVSKNAEVASLCAFLEDVI